MLQLRSIRHKLNWVVLLTTFATLCAASGAMVVFDQRNYRQTWERDLRTQAELLGLATAPALAFNDPRAAHENLSLLKARPDITAAAIYRFDGTLFAQYENGAAGPMPGEPAPDGIRVEAGHLVAFQGILDQGERVGTVYLRARDASLQHLMQYLTVLGLVTLVSLLLALLLSDRLISVVIRPIVAVSDVARRITASRDFSLRAHRTTDDEVGQVVDAFNDMLDELALRAQTLEQAHRETLRLNSELEERVQRRTAQLQEANRELEAFSYSASHDLRSPLRVIDSFSTVLEKKLGANLDERARHFLDRIRANVRHMSDLIDALLRLAQVSRSTLQHQETDLSAMASEALEQCREREPQRDAVVRIDSSLQVTADPALMNQVIQNLVANAWKFTSKVPAAQITVGSEVQQDGTRAYFVRDNGAGFDMAHAHHLFGAFQRLHGPSDFPGTGVGLATVHRIITRHEGKIWADSSPGNGATFYFTLGKGLDSGFNDSAQQIAPAASQMQSSPP